MRSLVALAWWCSVGVCFSATWHWYFKSLHLPPRLACEPWRARATNYSFFCLQCLAGGPCPRMTFKFQNEWIRGPSSEAVAGVFQKRQSLLQNDILSPLPVEKEILELPQASGCPERTQEWSLLVRRSRQGGWPIWVGVLVLPPTGRGHWTYYQIFWSLNFLVR